MHPFISFLKTLKRNVFTGMSSLSLVWLWGSITQRGWFTMFNAVCREAVPSLSFEFQTEDSLDQKTDTPGPIKRGWSAQTSLTKPVLPPAACSACCFPKSIAAGRAKNTFRIQSCLQQPYRSAYPIQTVFVLRPSRWSGTCAQPCGPLSRNLWSKLSFSFQASKEDPFV